MNDDRDTEGAGAGASAREVERVGVVIWDGSAPRSELRRLLGDALPLHFVRWQDRSYLAAIEQMRPCVIVAVEPDDELAADVAGLLACLITSYTPTILAMTLPPRPPTRRRSTSRSRAREGAEGASAVEASEQASSPAPVDAPRAPKVRLLVRQLGPCDSAQIASLADIVPG